MIATIFQDFATTDKPYYATIDGLLKRIKDCTVQAQVDGIRAETNKTKQKALKRKLPCILFSGKFTFRSDDSMVEHSGFVIMDFDKLNDPIKFREDCRIYPFAYSAFLSPTGGGVKLLVKIPADIKKHRGYYAALLQKFPTADPTGRNESRICYDTCDPDLWINKDAIEFTEYVDLSAPKIEPTTHPNSLQVSTNYAKVNIALEMIRNSGDGNKHDTLLKAAKLMGGYIASNAVDESEAVRLMEHEISLKGNVESLSEAKKTIKEGIKYGKQFPIEVIQYEKWKPVKYETPLNVTKESLDTFDFLAKRTEIDEYLLQWRLGTFQLGLTTGIPSFDTFYRFKRGNFNVFNGFDNVGKSTTIWYFAVLSAMYHDWKWLIYTSENKSGTFFKKAIEFYWGEKIDKISEMKYKIAYEFIDSHFKIIANEKMYNYKDILSMTEKVNDSGKIDGVLIDPYNALKIDLSDNSKLNTHEYHYEAASEMQLFAKKKDICVYLNCHVITFAMRQKTAPMKADTEGGGKFANKADDFVTIHRELQDKDKWMITELHVRKVKEIETGGGYTSSDEPYTLTMQNGLCRFLDPTGFDPVWNWHNLHGRPPANLDLPDPTPSALRPSPTFDTESPAPISTPRVKKEDFDHTEPF